MKRATDGCAEENWSKLYAWGAHTHTQKHTQQTSIFVALLYTQGRKQAQVCVQAHLHSSGIELMSLRICVCMSVCVMSVSVCAVLRTWYLPLIS